MPDDPAELSRDDAVTTNHLADLPADPTLFGIVNRVARALNVPMALVTVVDSKRQTFVAHVGLPADLATAQGTMRSWSFCQEAIRAGAPLVVPDAEADPRFAATPLVELKLVRSYAGFPVMVDGIGAVGTVCAISDGAREFSPDDLAILDLAAAAVSARLSAREPLTAMPPRRSQAGELPEIGTLLDDKYWITAALGSGGQGSVLLARDKLLGQLVAIKIVGDIPNAEETLLREARALASVRHPNLVAVHGWGKTPSGTMYLVLDYIAGESLADKLADLTRGDPRAFAVKAVRELAGALASLHAVGIFHGDVKPSNVLLDRSLDRAVLIDLGVGVFANARAERSPAGGGGGTPGYSAPEQFYRDATTKPSERADVYGLAATAYAIVCGRGPFDDAKVGKIGDQLRSAFAAPSELRPGLPKGVDDVLTRALSADADARFSSVLEFAEAFERALAGVPHAPIAGRAPPPLTRGRTFRVWREAMRVAIGSAKEAECVASLPAALRERFVAATTDGEWFPAEPFVAYQTACAARGAKLEVVGGAVVTRMIPDLLAALHVGLTPDTIVHTLPDVARRLHNWFAIDVTRSEPDRARVVMRMPRSFAPTSCRVWAGACCAALAAAGVDAEAYETACIARGDDSCVLEVHWREPSDLPLRVTE